ncbi:HU family DNA-binding protein [Carboxylicivirga caseinilyticus]|uniref:HU family DNA-binding protein n=1 Tax=Carboxylicivirga caseinilyticus TaxID=3417572 RepID=UPI003D33561F|nr:HU family DNA-binding protein [Marinilabiliaceae bacterium A049]
MPIKFKVIEKGQPGVAGGGTKKFYASASSTGELTLEKLTKRIEQNSTVSGADIRAVLYAMVEMMQESLEEGQIVRLGDLGSIRVNVSSNGEEEADKVNAHSIKGAKAVFTPGQRLKDMLKNLKYEKVS